MNRVPARGRAAEAAPSGLPDDWLQSWGQPTPFLGRQIGELRERMEGLAAGVPFFDRSAELGRLVGSADLRAAPLHRWYFYKEGFSPQLPPLLVRLLGVGREGTVADVFAGVGTTALALRSQDGVRRVVGVEYSPLACFIGGAKLLAANLDPTALRTHVERLGRFKVPPGRTRIPALAGFRNPDIFAPSDLRLLIAARDLVRSDFRLSEEERAFFLVGIAAVVEDVSGAMKDGRALRILRGRQRRRNGLTPSSDAVVGTGVHAVVMNQWLAMLEDLRALHADDQTAEAWHIQGDARTLREVRDESGAELLPDASVGLHLYSPPYLNCLDYSEVYKLELWLLELVRDHEAFRALRKGTLRSHPSIEFPERPRAARSDADVFGVIDSMTEFLAAHLSRAPVGRMVAHYFDDMYEVFCEQYRTLEPGGAIACVVANSTFSRRTQTDSDRTELWRIPVLTDVLLARLAEAAGLEGVAILGARNLRARNVNGGSARESILVGRKPRP